MQLSAEPSSYRDPSGSVYYRGNTVLRSVTKMGIDRFDEIWNTGYLQSLAASQRLVPVRRLAPNESHGAPADTRALLEHPRLSFISYPYEWSFAGLKAAALLHLDIQLEALERGITLSDATAYNIQFQGWRPIFIDHLSFQPYRDGEFWTAHQQFLDQFLNPLLLQALAGIAHNSWFRGSMGGIPTTDVVKLIPWYRRLSLDMLSHVTLPATLQRRVAKNSVKSPKLSGAKLPRSSYASMLQRLRNWIARLAPARQDNTTWQNYEAFRTYDQEEVRIKRAAVAEFIGAIKPLQLVDIGCNTGEFSEAALDAGAHEVIGFDFDHGALNLAYERAQTKDLRLLPLHIDIANPSPAQGWMGRERMALVDRCSNADALLALAVFHHLAIAKNIPLDQVIDWLVALAPQGLIEFVPKQDETVQQLLRLRPDIFPNYTQDTFLAALSARAHVEKTQQITFSGRLLVQYRRRS